MGVEPVFLLVSDFFVSFVGAEGAYYYVNAFFVIEILLVASLTAYKIKSPAYLYIFIAFCYASIVLTQIRFGLCLVSIIYGLVYFINGRKFSASVFFVFGVLNHYFGVVILILLLVSYVLTYLRINLLNIAWLIILGLLAVSTKYIIDDTMEILGSIFYGSIGDKVADNINNNSDDLSMFKSSNVYVILTLLYLYARVLSSKIVFQFNILLILALAVFVTNFNHVMHIRLFQLYALTFHIVVLTYIGLNIKRSYIEILIFAICPMLYLGNDLFRNNFFGI